MSRPRVICHMATSLDGRIVVDGWPSAAEVRREYEQVHARYGADGWRCGRATSNDIDGDHVVAIVSERVSDEYLAMLRAGLIDEVSVIVAPVADGRMGTPALFDVDADQATPMRLVLENVEQRDSGILWLRYRVDRSLR